MKEAQKIGELVLSDTIPQELNLLRHDEPGEIELTFKNSKNDKLESNIFSSSQFIITRLNEDRSEELTFAPVLNINFDKKIINICIPDAKGRKLNMFNIGTFLPADEKGEIIYKEISFNKLTLKLFTKDGKGYIGVSI